MSDRLNAEFGIDNALRIEKRNGLVCGAVKTEVCAALFYLHGAHVAAFRPAGRGEMLFMSSRSHFEGGKPIRGGIPICFPWFGAHEADNTAPAHGLVRTSCWRIAQTSADDSAVEVTLATAVDPFELSYRMRFSSELELQLSVTNTSADPVEFEVALHSYFAVSDVRNIEVAGLESTSHLDTLTGEVVPATGQPIRFTDETDRIYRPTSDPITIHDPKLKHAIEIEKSNSASTVVWNPWTDKAARMGDFGDDEWPWMCCIETANISPHQTLVAPGATTSMGATHRYVANPPTA